MAIFVFIFSISLVIIFFLKNTGLRESIIKSYIAQFLLIAASTEIFSFFGAVTYGALCLFWIALTAVSLMFLLFVLKRNDVGTSIKKWLRTLADFRGQEAIFLLLIACVLSITLVVALVYPPNNWDSMTYHMSRVTEWIHRGSVDFYPTSIDRQNYQPPLAEFAILHLQLLSKSDRFANIIQWYSFFASIVFVTLIAKEFQLSLQGQLSSAVIAATIPMAILQSSSTQNDLVTAAFCLAFAYFLLRFVRTLSFQDAVFCALSLGLALLTKGTAYLYCCAIGLTIGIGSLLSTTDPKKILILFGRLAAIVVAALVLNIGHFSRNYLLYAHPLSTAAGYTNDKVSATILLSNIVRNAALHLGTPFQRINSYTSRAVRSLLGDQLNNPRSTMGSTTFSSTSFSLHEDYAGNPLHFVLAAIGFVLLPFLSIPRKRSVCWYAASVLLAVVLYCAFLKWQPWATRLHTPIFLLSVPLIATVVAGFKPYYKVLSVCLAILLFICSTPFLVLNKTRSLAAITKNSILSSSGRLKSYFINRPELYEDYTATAKIIMDEGVAEVGLCFDYDDYEYPLWVLVGRQASRGSPRFRHVGVLDISRTREKRNMPAPALVVATKRLDGNLIHGKGRREADVCAHRGYFVIFDSTHIRIWKLKST